MPTKRPILIVNPRSDTAFVRRAQSLLEEGIPTAGELEDALRATYPRVLVRERELAQEPPAWYVYREGLWVPSES